jgi:hypothetical protein
MEKVRIFFFFIIVILAFPFSNAWAEELTVQFIDHSYERDSIETAFSIVGDISNDTIDAIRNGITAKFFITFQISNSSRFIGRSRTTFRERSESFNISYDVWENTFILEDNRRMNYHTVRGYGNIIRTMNTALNPLTMDITGFEPAEQIYLRAKIKIQTIRLFPPFGIFLLFFDPWNFESDWIQTEVRVYNL